MTSKAWIGSWSTPIVVKIHGKDQLILSVPKSLKSFDPANGKEIWSCAGLGNLVYTSPLFAPDPLPPGATADAPRGGIIVTMSGFHGPAFAVRVDKATGDIATDRLWHHVNKQPQRIGTGVIIGPHLYMVSENGTPQCFELKTGKEVWQADKRPAGSTWSSMVHADGRLYVTDRDGTTMVFAATPEYRVLASNRLGEHVEASVAVANGELFIRTYKHLWCIGK